MFLPQGWFSLVLAALSVVAWRLTLAQRSAWVAEPFLCVLGCSAGPGLVPHQSHALFWCGDLIPCPEFPYGLCGGEWHLQGKCHSPQFCAAVPQGSSRAGGPGVAQNPKLSTLLVKEG